MHLGFKSSSPYVLATQDYWEMAEEGVPSLLSSARKTIWSQSTQSSFSSLEKVPFLCQHSLSATGACPWSLDQGHVNVAKVCAILLST